MASLSQLLFVLLVFPGLALADSDASQANDEECFAQKNFSLNLFLKGNSVSVAREGCNSKVVIFQLPGTRWTFNTCDPQIRMGVQNPMDAPVDYLYAGSAHCPQPLFGIDIELKSDNLEKSNARIKEVLELVGEIRKGNSQSLSLNAVGGQLLCFERILKRYYNQCQAFAEPGALPSTTAK